jgi:cell division protein FtsQ
LSGTKANGKGITLDWESDAAENFRRPRRPVEVRRRAGWKQGLLVAAKVFLGFAAVAAAGGVGFLAYQFAVRGPFFRLSGPEAVEVVGGEQVAAAQVAERFAEDAGRSVFTVPLEARRRSLEEIAWVESASVRRVLPGRLRVYVRERTPVAFLRQGTSLELVDAQGVVLPVPEGASYAFPVLAGLPEALSVEERRARVALYQEFVADLDRDAKGYSAQISEVDLSDPDNLRASLLEPDGAVWLFFGRERYQEKFETYLQHRAVWQKNGEAVRAVDLRYRGQIVLNPETPGEGQR